MSRSLFDSNQLFEHRKKLYDDDSHFLKQGFELQGEDMYDWMPESTKLFYNKNNNRYAFKDLSGGGWQGPAANVVKNGVIDGDLFKKEYDSLRSRNLGNITGSNFFEMYPYYLAEGRGQSNLHAGSLRDRPYAGTYSQIGPGNTYGDYTLTNRRRGQGYITDVKDSSGNVVHSYSTPTANDFGGALDWIDSKKNNEYSNLNGALREFDPSSVSDVNWTTTYSQPDIDAYSITLNAKPLAGYKNWYEDDRGYAFRSPEKPQYAYRVSKDTNGLNGWWYDDPKTRWTWSESTGWILPHKTAPGVWLHNDSNRYIRSSSQPSTQSTIFTDYDTGQELFTAGPTREESTRSKLFNSSSSNTATNTASSSNNTATNTASSPANDTASVNYTAEDFAKNNGVDTQSTQYSNVQRILNYIDTDKDGGVSSSEYQALLSKYDTNGDGKITEPEYANLLKAIIESEGNTTPTAKATSPTAEATSPTASEVISETVNPTDLSLESIDYKGLPAAEQDLLIETLQDAAAKHDWQNMAAMDKFNILKEYLPNISSARLAVLAEQVTDAQSAFNILVQGSLTKENEVNMASAALAQAEMDSNLNRYRNITDTLRGDRLSAERAGEGRGNSFADRLLLQAEMSAADKYAALQDASNLSDAKRRYDAAVTGAGERADAVKLLADTTLANNVSQVALQEKTSIFSALQARVDRQEDIADELAQVIGSTQEKTLPAVKMAELIIEQASQEGKMEIANAEEKKQAIMDAARELLANASLLQLLAEQIGDEALVLGAEFTEEQKDFVQRIQNLKNIPGLVDAIIKRVGDDMFATYRAIYQEIGAIWAAGIVAGLVDQDGYVIPDTAFAETTAGDNAFEGFNAIKENSGSDGVEGAVDKGVDVVGDLINGIFKNIGKDD
jgi:hypothetical protein